MLVGVQGLKVQGLRVQGEGFQDLRFRNRDPSAAVCFGIFWVLL